MARQTRKAELEQQIATLEELRVSALAGNQAGSAVAAVKECNAVRKDLARLIAVEAAGRKRSPIERLRALAKVAERDGSWVAASKYRQTEAELLAQQADAERREREQAKEHLTPEQLIAEVIAAVETLSRDMLVLLDEAVQARLAAR